MTVEELLRQRTAQLAASQREVTEFFSKLLDRDSRIRTLEDENNAMRDMLKRLIVSYEETLDAEYSHRGERNPVLNEARAMVGE